MSEPNNTPRLARVCWRIIENGTTGIGELLPREEAERRMQEARERFGPGYEYWIEYE